jgi:hypothetical protein
MSERKLYCSKRFQKARAFVERRNEDWFILSAKYGMGISTLLRRFLLSPQGARQNPFDTRSRDYSTMKSVHEVSNMSVHELI